MMMKIIAKNIKKNEREKEKVSTEFPSTYRPPHMNQMKYFYFAIKF